MRKVVIDGFETEEYDAEEIVPIPAKCTKCGYDWVEKDAIRAPSLDCCLCFWCGAILKPHPKYPKVIDAKTRAHTPQLELL